MKKDDSKGTVSRRDVLMGASTVAAAALGSTLPGAAQSRPVQSPKRDDRTSRKGPPGKPPYNIVFIIVDQQTHKLNGGPEYSLPGTDTIARNGVTFANHYTASAMCTPSRATFLTGRPPQYHHVIDQQQFAFVPTLNPEIPNVGSVLKELGYKTAYFGKFEMDKAILDPKPTVNYSTAAQAYGFDVFGAGGDIGSDPLSGFENDPFIAGESVRWLRNAAMQSRKDGGQPFLMVASFVNPHDIMYGDGNVPGEPPVQKPVTPSATPPPPPNSIYEQTWALTLPASLAESLTTDGTPSALNEYRKGWDGWSGTIPTDRDDMWTIFYNYYLNTIQDNERNVKHVVDVFDEMDLWRDTVIVFTADHGEMGGSHGGLKGKGPFVYEQNAHVPMIIAHPTAPSGQTCTALTSHLDLVPTFVGLTGLPESQRPANTKSLPGHDFSSLLANPTEASLEAVRPGVLFNYLGLATVDAQYLESVMNSQMLDSAQPPISQANLTKRGLLSFAFDGRYKFGRYYAPTAFNTPQTMAEILNDNDVQLFDLRADPHELHNLALEHEKHGDTILRMNRLLNDLIAAEVGVNDGRFLKPILEGKPELPPGG